MFLIKKKNFIVISLTFLILIGLSIAIKYSLKSTYPDYIVWGNGRIESDEVAISSKFGGEIESIYVDEGSDVKKGQLLAKIDSSSMEAKLNSLKKQSQQILDEIDVIEAEIKSVESDIRFYKKELARIEELLARDFATEADYDEKINLVERSEAAFATKKAQKKSLNSSYKSILAEVQSLQIDIEDMSIYSPTDGFVLYRVAEVGEVIRPSGRMFIIVNPDELFMTVYINQMLVGKVRVGDEAIIKLDALPDKSFGSSVTFISEEAEFTPKEVETYKERQKLVFRARLKPNSNKERFVKVGMPGYGFVKLDNSREWPKGIR